ncbi:hypothetical protein FXO38_14450 [Capsicum annuum]|nr:hypothetical protein FXO38_14450 [Capsicum annuum]KAF3685928.1 hypothetical protein FXO37_00130 [Capsicum annuum]
MEADKWASFSTSDSEGYGEDPDDDTPLSLENVYNLKSLGYKVGRPGIPWSVRRSKNLRLGFDVYPPNSRFRKSAPGDPCFVLCLASEYPPSKEEIEDLVENERVSYASTWWEIKRLQRARNDNFDSLDWDELKALMRERYVTERYKQEQLTKLYNLRQGDRSIEEYYDEFQNLILRLDILKPPNHCLARFKDGLCYKVVSQLVVHKFDRIEDLVEATIEVERNNHAKKTFGWDKSYKPLEKKPFDKTIQSEGTPQEDDRDDGEPERVVEEGKVNVPCGLMRRKPHDDAWPEEEPLAVAVLRRHQQQHSLWRQLFFDGSCSPAIVFLQRLMDKSWIGKPRNTPEYECGLTQFLDFAFMNAAVEDRIKYSCPLYYFKKWYTRDIVHAHLICKQFPRNYITWVIHGESNVLNNSPNVVVTHDILPPNNPVELLINEAFQGLRHEGTDASASQVAGEEGISNDTPASNNTDFLKFLKDRSQELYDGCKYSKLEFLLKLYHIKCLGGLSDKGMGMILDLLRDAFDFAKLPSSFYDAKKTIKKLCLDYIKIDVCLNDCMLYWGDDANEEKCKHCHTSRWKPTKKNDKDHAPGTSKKQKKKSAKILRYFPLIPRFKRLFMCSKIAEHIRWNGENVKNDGILRHLRDGPRTVSNNIDVYPQPLIKELNKLWYNDVETFDSSKNEMFRMRAPLMWTMVEAGKKHGRATLYLATHKKEDGSYVNEAVKDICEKIELAVSQSTMDESEVYPNDVVGKVLGKEHSGKVRCLGLGVVPSRSFKQTHPHLNDAHNNSQENYKELVNSHSLMMNSFKTYMIMKEDTIPGQFTGFFTPSTPTDVSTGPLSDMNGRSSGDGYSSDNH